MKSFIQIDNIPYEKIIQSVELGIFEYSYIAVSLVSEQYKFIYCNKSFIQMYNLSETPEGKNINEILFLDNNGFEENLKTYKVAIFLRESSKNIYGISISYPMYDAQNRFRGVFIEIMPMTSNKETLSKIIETMRTIEMKTYPIAQEKEFKEGLFTFDTIIGQSSAMQNLRRRGLRIAQSDEPVLITGESGTGKEMVAQAVHMASARAENPFICVNCAALPGDLAESELFGYEAGAFTGAKSKGMIGKFEEAKNGTIFLDEIGEMPLSLQAKLLRVLESGEIQKIAHKGLLRTNFRLVAATNKNLVEMVRAGRFRADLYYRLNVFELNIPPLRDRESDVFLLLRFFMDQALGTKRARQTKLEEGLVEIFQKYPWPGNVRELKNIMTHACFLLGEEENVLGFQHLPTRFQQESHLHANNNVEFNVPQPSVEVPLKKEKAILQAALTRYCYNKVLMAKELGISRSKLYRDLHKYGLLH